MTDELSVLDWEPEYINLPQVQNLHFGDTGWGREIDQFIKVEVNDVIAEFGTQVWLYLLPEHGVVGFGSLGKTRWQWPIPQSKRDWINIIPALGLDQFFWGKPEGPGVRRYSAQIMDHIIYQAERFTNLQPALGLFVHPENAAAIKVYERAGFQHWTQRQPNEQGVQYIGMLLKLRRGEV